MLSSEKRHFQAVSRKGTLYFRGRYGRAMELPTRAVNCLTQVQRQGVQEQTGGDGVPFVAQIERIEGNKSNLTRFVNDKEVKIASGMLDFI